MSIPDSCTVLVIGGGPGGSYCAAALAREGINVVLLEAEKFPRYHIGKSMLPSFRHFLQFIDIDTTFLEHGFTQKNGGAFRLVQNKQEGYTDFIAGGGTGNFTWNVIRSEADELIFRHAEKSGALTFDGVQVNGVHFNGDDSQTSEDISNGLATPGSASFTCRPHGIKGHIKFKYVVDARGRAGVVATKHLKNRSYNKSLKNIAYWGYWKGTSIYGEGTERENTPFFEALTDQSGWAWLIPLHDGTTSIGAAMNQDMATARRKSMPDSCLESFYRSSLQLAPKLFAHLVSAELTTTVNPSQCPFRRNHNFSLDKMTMRRSHGRKTAFKQSRASLSEISHDCSECISPDQKLEGRDDISTICAGGDAISGTEPNVHRDFSPEEVDVIKNIEARKLLGTNTTYALDCFGIDVIEGLRPNIQHGQLGLVRVQE